MDREAFERDGYLVFDPQVSGETVDGAVSDLEEDFHDPEPPRRRWLIAGKRREPKYSVQTPDRIQDAWKASRHVKQIALAPTTLRTLEGMYGREPLPFQTLNFRVGTEQDPHSDTIHFNSKPPGFMCGVWVALEDIDMDNGPLVYYPGSHRLPEVTMTDVGVEVDPDTDNPYEAYEAGYVPHIAATIEREGLEAKYATLKKGQAIIWAANLLHGGAPQRDRSRTRHSQVTHYFFEGCDYWIPLRSTADRVVERPMMRIG